jgi:hypothetical protein
MNLQLNDILSNPALINEVSDDTLQKWIQQYPYVSLFHLYALKRTTNYSETDLHKTAFYFNNREKLFYLLNDKQFESKIAPPAYEEKKNVIIKDIVQEEQFSSTINEKQEKQAIELPETNLVDDVKLTEPALPVEDKIIDILIDETKEEKPNELNTETIISIDEISKSALEQEIVPQALEETTQIDEETNVEEEVKENTGDYKVIEIIVDHSNDKPLSIAEQIMLEIQQLKEERARKEAQLLSEEKNIQEETTLPEFETIQDTTEKMEPIEEVTSTEITNQDVDTIVEVENLTQETQEEVLELTEATNEIVDVDEAVSNNIQVEQPQLSEEKTEEKTKTEEKKLTIQEEVIARIQRIKEEREKQIQEFAASRTITPTEQQLDSPEEKTVDEKIVSEEIITKKILTNEISPVKEAETTIQPLSIQDEIIARIQRIKDERAKQLSDVDTTSSKNEIIETRLPETATLEQTAILPDLTIAETEISTDKTEEHHPPVEEIDSVNEDIKIVEKTERIIIPLDIENVDEKNPLEEIISIAPVPEFEQDIELIETKLQQELKQEMEDVDVLATIHEPEHTTPEIATAHSDVSIVDILPQPELEVEIAVSTISVDENITEDVDRFSEMFPEPLLVKVDTAALQQEKSTVTLEQLQEEVIVPIASVENNATVEEIIEEDLNEQLEQIAKIEHEPLISEKSDLFIPSIEEDSIEEHVVSEIITDKETPVTTTPEIQKIVHEHTIEDEIPAQKLDETVIKEPHTFVEWLKLLDGNLQIQTSESIKEPENWIEIPRYEVEQTIAHKKEIQKEEQKLFEPNFEEGEIDLFNEIDEEVTKVATESVSFKQDMMTETLARIYHKQGKTDKALEIYNTLRLKFPEKSAYFAALIAKIEKEK